MDDAVVMVDPSNEDSFWEEDSRSEKLLFGERNARDEDDEDGMLLVLPRCDCDCDCVCPKLRYKCSIDCLFIIVWVLELMRSFLENVLPTGLAGALILFPTVEVMRGLPKWFALGEFIVGV